MHNDLYVDMVVGCLKARTVPVNVNYNYTPREVRELLDYVRPRAVIYHKSLGAKFADVLAPDSADLLLSVDDGSGAPELPGAVALEDALSQGDIDQNVDASPDDLLMICTGGTTGRPKGVLWRQSDIYVSSMVGADHACCSRDPRQGEPEHRIAVVRRVAADACRRNVDGVRGDHGRPDRRAVRHQQETRPAIGLADRGAREGGA